MRGRIHNLWRRNLRNSQGADVQRSRRLHVTSNARLSTTPVPKSLMRKQKAMTERSVGAAGGRDGRHIAQERKINNGVARRRRLDIETKVVARGQAIERVESSEWNF